MKYIILTIIVCLTINTKKPKNNTNENCIHGTNNKNKECSKCKEGFELVNGICKSENTTLINHICEGKEGVCKSCNKGYTLVGDKCEICKTENCQNENHHHQHSLSNETNYNISTNSLKIQNCVNYSKDNKSCISCQSGYDLNTANICVKSNSNAFLITSIVVGSVLVAIIIVLIYYVLTLKNRLSNKNSLI